MVKKKKIIQWTKHFVPHPPGKFLKWLKSLVCSSWLSITLANHFLTASNLKQMWQDYPRLDLTHLYLSQEESEFKNYFWISATYWQLKVVELSTGYSYLLWEPGIVLWTLNWPSEHVSDRERMQWTLNVFEGFFPGPRTTHDHVARYTAFHSFFLWCESRGFHIVLLVSDHAGLCATQLHWQMWCISSCNSKEDCVKWIWILIYMASGLHSGKFLGEEWVMVWGCHMGTYSQDSMGSFQLALSSGWFLMLTLTAWA